LNPKQPKSVASSTTAHKEALSARVPLAMAPKPTSAAKPTSAGKKTPGANKKAGTVDTPKAGAPSADEGGALEPPKNKDEVLQRVSFEGLPNPPAEQIVEILSKEYTRLVKIFAHYCKFSECATVEMATRIRLGARPARRRARRGASPARRAGAGAHPRAPAPAPPPQPASSSSSRTRASS
jgi:hypothetical protein